MSKTKVVVYGFSTEGYSIACQMAIKGIDVFIIDDEVQSAISLKPEIAKTYPDIHSLKENEPSLKIAPIDVVISQSEYLFFAPRIRKIGHDTRTEILGKFKNAVSKLKEKSSIVYNIPTGSGENSENISFLEHITGFKVGKSIFYYYYPLSNKKHLDAIGSLESKKDNKLVELICLEKKQNQFIEISSLEYFHAINILSHFCQISSIIEVCKIYNDIIKKDDLSYNNYNDIFIDDMFNEIYDLHALGQSIESKIMISIINGCIKGIDGYVKHLIDEVKLVMKKNKLIASKTKVALFWTFDPYEIRGDKIEALKSLTTKLKDYVGGVESYKNSDFDLFHNDGHTIVISCSKTDFLNIEKNKKGGDLIILKANLLCEVVQKR